VPRAAGLGEIRTDGPAQRNVDRSPRGGRIVSGRHRGAGRRGAAHASRRPRAVAADAPPREVLPPAPGVRPPGGARRDPGERPRRLLLLEGDRRAAAPSAPHGARGGDRDPFEMTLERNYDEPNEERLDRRAAAARRVRQEGRAWRRLLQGAGRGPEGDAAR